MMLSLSSLASCQDRISFPPMKKYLNPAELYNKSLKTTTTGPYNESLKTTAPWIGLYVDDTQLGVAVSVFSKKYVPTHCSRTLAMDENIGSALQDLISKYCVSSLVIGYPFHFLRMFPTDVSFGMQVKDFVEKVIETSKFEDINYTFWDNSSTTKMLYYVAKQTFKTTRILMPYEFVTAENAAYQTLQRYLDVMSSSQDPASSPSVLRVQIEVEPSAKGEERNMIE